ncbi:MAG: hypothetical protein AAGK33_04680 [Pseudomonadota bacterium]
MIAKLKSAPWTGFAVNTAMAVAIGFAAHTAMGDVSSLAKADAGMALSMAGQAQVLASVMAAIIAVPPLLACQMGVSACWKRFKKST